ncbi:hypothetical protein [Nocardiopsis tropica]|uniref:DUF4177 domain-containing protein n=1 Tax=Nocardiopsis tropica TaxID=109330 RepID=A0ABU7L2F5_9ACTN|nr:hypothetical protein [Nocardiopsis umidischolae]MEE2055748.1 hypothetical protein [Nocardiopsis umidischolae]
MAVHVSEWDYRVEETEGCGLSVSQMRNLGGNGWELTSEVVLPDLKAHGGFKIRAVFKKPRR